MPMTQEQIDQCRADGLKEYVVELREDDKGFDYEEGALNIVFTCWAEDMDHAAEQAFDAYPNCSIIAVGLV